ncbi:hypothetical protein ACS0TY_001399 [Phlomoides rotata]
MQKPKELVKEVSISAPTPSTNTKKKTKSLHPPIETHWQLGPTKQQRKTSLSFKVMRSFKNMLSSQSAKRALEGTRNPKDEKIVDSFRELLFLEGHLPEKQFDYHTLLRFLRMRDFDLMKAKEMLVQYIKWREEFGVDAIFKDFVFEEYEQVKKCYPHGFHGVDRYGRPVYIERIGMVDLDTFLRVTTIDRFVKHHVYEQERTLNYRFPSCSLAAKKHIASALSILDVKDVGMNQFSKPARHLFMEIQKIDSNYYPETLHQLYIINAGSGFRVLWKAIRAFLDARTLAKIRVLGTDYKSSLIEAIDPSNLPSFLGGHCTCSGSGGCLFSDKGPWNDPEITQTLEGMLCTEDEQEGGERNRSNGKSASFCDNEKLRYEDASDVRDTSHGREYRGDLLLQRIQSFEPVLEDAKQKIRMLETALRDTKLVLEGVGQLIQELKNEHTKKQNNLVTLELLEF